MGGARASLRQRHGILTGVAGSVSWSRTATQTRTGPSACVFTTAPRTHGMCKGPSSSVRPRSQVVRGCPRRRCVGGTAWQVQCHRQERAKGFIRQGEEQAHQQSRPAAVAALGSSRLQTARAAAGRPRRGRATTTQTLRRSAHRRRRQTTSTAASRRRLWPRSVRGGELGRRGAPRGCAPCAAAATATPAAPTSPTAATASTPSTTATAAPVAAPWASAPAHNEEGSHGGPHLAGRSRSTGHAWQTTPQQ